MCSCVSASLGINELKPSAFDNLDKAFDSEIVPKFFIKGHPKTSISSLPTEILEIIFMHSMPIDGTSYSTPPSKALAQWLSVTHVCRYWRKVALNYKDLWTQLDLRLPNFALQMLERSNPKPVELEFTAQYGSKSGLRRGARVLKKILGDHASRIRCLSINPGYRIGGYEFLDDALEAFIGPATNLYKLELIAIAWDEVPDGFLRYGAPRLAELLLQDFHIPPDSPLLSNLKDLTWYGNGEPHVMLSGEEFFDILRKSPDLEALSVQGILPSSFPSDIITLSCLQGLCLDSHSQSEAVVALDLCNHIIFPEKTKLNLFVPYQSYPLTLANATFSFFSRYFSPASSTTNPRLVNTLRIEATDDSHDFLIEAWYDRVSSTTLLVESVDRHSPIYIHFEYDDDSWPPFPQLMTTVVQTVPFAALETFDIRDLSHQHSILETLLGAVCWSATLKHIYVGGLCAYRLLDILQTGIPTKSNGLSGQAELPFPALETLLVTSVDDRPLLLRSMLRVFRFRLENRGPIRKLLLRCCGLVSRADIELLEEVVGEIDWDGDRS
ncbi:hypothetical protein Moror_9386 [Moniliophthora roreri MCA 2997]|uniref:F-box domain-containing protein n=1 Tax=Moniliophthora roreri (strain MCA 2997) TaxID=1381753 RepID=V2X0S2_MONRO|nr:hypothetical protein Moror_9386 [Moniliophthora roreri MCA 2997]